MHRGCGNQFSPHKILLLRGPAGRLALALALISGVIPGFQNAMVSNPIRDPRGNKLLIRSQI